MKGLVKATSGAPSAGTIKSGRAKRAAGVRSVGNATRGVVKKVVGGRSGLKRSARITVVVN